MLVLKGKLLSDINASENHIPLVFDIKQDKELTSFSSIK